MNQGQQEAFQKVLSFVRSKDRAMLINGQAGTGKSYLIEQIINQAQKFKVGNIKQILLTATTHKALRVYSFGGKTIHSTLGIVPDFKNDCLMPPMRFVKNALIIIDEASMINDELMGFILQATKGSKLLFVGDMRQLPPVKGESPMEVLGIETVTLTEVMRSKEAPAISDLSILCSRAVDDGSTVPIKLVEGQIEVRPWDDAALAEVFKAVDRSEDVLITCYTNQTCQDVMHIWHEEKGVQFPAIKIPYISNNNIQGLDDESPITLRKADYRNIRLGMSQFEAVETPMGYIPYDYLATKKLATKEAYKKNYLPKPLMDLRMPWLSTVHKAQGSTVDTVYVLMNDLCVCSDPNTMRRLLYVAATRARKKIVFIGEPSKGLAKYV